jgi:hypothetical protein
MCYAIGFEKGWGIIDQNKKVKEEYDREHASKCVGSDWYNSMSRFNDRQFEI